MTETDVELLRQYTRDHSQEAFTRLVERHLDLVYAAALRQVRSHPLAEEVAQSVFADLARDAGKLKPETILTAWLYQVSRRTAVDVIRKESRRQAREQIAVEMNAMNATEPSWPQIEPLLDEAMAALDETDRAAVLLRYFENKSFREVGAQLRVSDDTAQKRVSRALEKLRELLSQRGVRTTATALSVVVAANAVQAAPVGLAAVVSTAALAGTAVTASAVIAATKTITMTTVQKSLVAVTVAVLAGAGIYEARQVTQLREQNQMVQHQMASLAAQIQQLQQERDNATNRLAGLLAQNSQSKTHPDEMEILSLRGEVSRLRADSAELATLKKSAMSSAIEPMAKEWTAKVGLLKNYLREHPDAGIPEIQFMTDRDWLASIDPSSKDWPLATDKDFLGAIDIARDQAQLDFEARISNALMKFNTDNNQVFPTDLAQLRPYLDPAVADVLEQQYEIMSTSNLPATAVPDNGRIAGDSMIARKSSAREHGQRITIVPLRVGGPLGLFTYQATYY